MVAITVILAAVIASFVFGMCGKVKAAPNAQIVLEDSDDMIDDGNNDDIFDIKHYGGDTLKCDELKLIVSVKGIGRENILIWDGNAYFNGTNLTCYVPDRLISVGDTVTVAENNSTFLDLADVPATITLRIIHIPTNTIIFEGDVLVQ